jgi:hypothetical protein
LRRPFSVTEVQFDFLLREIDLRCNIVLWIALEVLIPIAEACNAGPYAVGKLPDEDVVVFQRLVVPLAFYCNAIFRPCKFVCQAHELVVTLEVRVLLLQAEEGAEGDVELGVGVDAGSAITASGEHSGAGVGDVGENGGFFSDVSLDRGNEVRNQIESTLLHYVYLGKGLIDGLILLNQRILCADIAAACKEQNEDK